MRFIRVPIGPRKSHVTYYAHMCACGIEYWSRQGQGKKHCGCLLKRACLRQRALAEHQRFLKENIHRIVNGVTWQ